MGRCFFHVDSSLRPGCQAVILKSKLLNHGLEVALLEALLWFLEIPKAAARSKLPKLNHALWMIYGSSFMMDLCQCEFLWIYNMKLNEFLWIESIHTLLHGSETTAVLDSWWKGEFLNCTGGIEESDAEHLLSHSFPLDFGGCRLDQAAVHPAVIIRAKPTKPTVNIQWEFQDPKMEVLYHIRPYFVGIFPYIGLI